MNETITRRVSRLISGSLNAVIDAAENASPLIVMKESIREVEQATTEVRTELGKLVVQQHTTQNRIDSEQKKHQELSEQISFALKEGREDLAEAAISRQMDIEVQLPILKNSLEDASKEGEELEGFIAALQAKKREMQDELKFFESQSKESSIDSTQDQVSKAESAFNRVMGMNTPSSIKTDESKLAELEELTRKNRIQERLSKMKATQE